MKPSINKTHGEEHTVDQHHAIFSLPSPSPPLPLPHLGCEDTDAIHPRKPSTTSRLSTHRPAATFTPSVAEPLVAAVCPSFPVVRQPRSLAAGAHVLSPAAAEELPRPTCRVPLPAARLCPCFIFHGSWSGHCDLGASAWPRLRFARTRAEGGRHAVKRRRRGNTRRQARHTWMHRPTLRQADTYTHTHTHKKKPCRHINCEHSLTHTTLLFYQVSLCLAGTRPGLSEL